MKLPDFLTVKETDLQNRCSTLAHQVAALDPKLFSIDSRERQIRGLSQHLEVFDITQPASCGGSEGSALDLTIARETFGSLNVAHERGLLGPTPGLLENVREPLRNSFLMPYLAGEMNSGFGFTEPADAQRYTWAEIDGEELIINGQKSYVTGGAEAHFINVLVDIPRSGKTMLLIETSRPGVDLTRKFASSDGSQHAAFTFTNVRVPATHVIGPIGSGMKRALEQVSDVRMAIAATSTGLCSFVLEHLAAYLQETDGKKSLAGSNDLTRMRYGGLRIEAFAVRSALYRTARLIDIGENAVNEASAVKVLATEALSRIVDEAIQIIGGQALTETHPLTQISSRVKALQLAEGTSDILKINVARGFLDLNKGTI